MSWRLTPTPKSRARADQLARFAIARRAELPKLSAELADDLGRAIDKHYSPSATVRPPRGRQRERRPGTRRSTRARRTASTSRDDSEPPEPAEEAHPGRSTREPRPWRGTRRDAAQVQRQGVVL